MFRGVSTLSLDVKGRLAVPTKYREGLQRQSEGRMVVTIHHAELCLWLYPLNEWEEIERRLVNLPTMNPVSQRLQRILIGHASDLEMDAAGRVLLPPPLREFGNLEKHVVMIGQGNKFEIWSEEHWTEQREKWLKQERSEGPLPIELESLSL